MNLPSSHSPNQIEKRKKKSEQKQTETARKRLFGVCVCVFVCSAYVSARACVFVRFRFVCYLSFWFLFFTIQLFVCWFFPLCFYHFERENCTVSFIVCQQQQHTRTHTKYLAPSEIYFVKCAAAARFYCCVPPTLPVSTDIFKPINSHRPEQKVFHFRRNQWLTNVLVILWQYDIR